MRGQASDGLHPMGGTQEAKQRRGKHLPILLPHPKQQDALQRTHQAHATGNSPLRMDQHAPTIPLRCGKSFPDSIKCQRTTVGTRNALYMGL